METVDEPLPNVTPKTVANVLRIDAPAVDRMHAALNVIDGLDFMLILGWAAAKAQSTTNSEAFLGSVHKRADFGEMLLEFEHVHMLIIRFNAVVVELKSS